MYSLKGFIRVNELMNNVPNNESIIGELSVLSMTYSREKGFYTKTATPGLELVSFSSKLDENNVVSTIEAPDDLVTFTLKIAKWVNDNCQNTAIMGHVNGSYPDYLAALTAYATGNTFTSYAFSNLTMGDLITLPLQNVTDKSMPEWISWHMSYSDGQHTKQAVVKLWFADQSFLQEFDEYEIVVVPPLNNLDDLFLGYTQVKALMDAFTKPISTDKIQVAKGIYPPTSEKTLDYLWYDNLNPPNSLITSWSFVVYGAVGQNLDILLEALRNYILSHSTHNQSQWELRLPDIFRTTEFIITPMWNRYAIPNLTVQAGVYSPMVNFNQDIDEVLLTMLNYPEQHVRTHIMSGIFMYKSLAFYVVGSPNNRNNNFDFTDILPDYFAVSTDSLDFGKMSPATQSWVMFIVAMLEVAESMTNYSSVPLNMSRVIRNGIMYVASSLNNIEYLITSKKYFVDNVPPPQDL